MAWEAKESGRECLANRGVLDDCVKGFQVGGVDYILKPFNMVELNIRIKNHLNLNNLNHINLFWNLLT